MTRKKQKTEENLDDLGDVEKPANILSSHKAITLLGPSQAGKTYLFSTLLHSGHASKELAEYHVSFNSDFKGSPLGNKNWNLLRTLYDAILTADTDHSGGTDIVTDYPICVSYRSTTNARPPRKRKRIGFRLFAGGSSKKQPVSPRPPEQLETKNFLVVDGRGADLTAGRFLPDNDTATEKMIKMHYRALYTSVGAVISIPLKSQTAGDHNEDEQVNDIEMQGLEELFKDQDFIRNSKLKRISVCLTQYDAAFLRDGKNAFKKATDRDNSLNLIKGTGYYDIFEALNALQSRRSEENRIDIQIFPCSSFGFVGGNGAANFYPSKKYFGLLTRQIDKSKFGAHPDLKDHFPVPIDVATVKELWHPFNVGAPFFFAATGLVSGPLNFSLDEVFTPDVFAN